MARTQCAEVRLQIAVAGLGLLFSFGLILLALGAESWLADRAPAGFVVQACAGLDTRGAGHVWLWWISPHFSTVDPSMLLAPFNVCGPAPWLPFLPQRGSVRLAT